MLLQEPPAVAAAPHSVCLVAEDGASLTDRARDLAAKGGAVHVLDCSRVAPLPVRNVVDSRHADRSDAVRHALERLHAERRFDCIEFPTAGGLGFRTVQAKRAGLGFDGATLAVRLDGCNAWRRDRDCRWPSGPEELELDFAERYAFENADERTADDPAMLAYVRGLGWDDRGDAAPPDAAACQPSVTVAVPHYNLGRYLPECLASLAAQTYGRLEVVVIDDGSTDPHSREVFSQMEYSYPQYRFLRQANAGIGAARNRGLREAAGEYFLPMDADNVARPDMVERFVAGIRRDPGLGAMTCYCLAFADGASPTRGPYLYAHRPTGGPHVLAAIRNVYGDANALFRTAAFRAVGGYETDRDSSFEDWEAFVKLVHAGRGVGVLPDCLFYYRHREAGFSRVTNDYRNRQRVLRQFRRLEALPPAERALLWDALYGFHRRADQTRELLRYRIADRFYALCARAPFAARWLKGLLRMGRGVVGLRRRE